MKNAFCSACLIFSALALPHLSNASSYIYTVPATANISSAGLGVSVAPGGGGAGTLPIFVPIDAGQQYITINASGSVSQAGPGYYHDADGYTSWGSDIYAYGGISGFKADVALPLTAVFLTDAAPEAPAPATIDFRAQGLGLNFSTLSPLIGQVFFVGDGESASQVVQEFFIPEGATRLFLGFCDAPYSTGPVGAFNDNVGSLSVSVVTVVPEPCAISILALGGLIWWSRRDSRLCETRH